MGYTTDFHGSFSLDKPLTVAHLNYLQRFAEIRHMKWDAKVLGSRPDPVREAVGLPVGAQGQFCVSIQDSWNADGLLDYNRPPGNCPGLWCQWVPSDDGRRIMWDGGEKFYAYVEWLEYLIKNFLKPWGYKLSGEVSWQGEDSSDSGVIFCEDNKVEAVGNSIINPGPSWKKGRK